MVERARERTRARDTLSWGTVIGAGLRSAYWWLAVPGVGAHLATLLCLLTPLEDRWVLAFMVAGLPADLLLLATAAGVMVARAREPD